MRDLLPSRPLRHPRRPHHSRRERLPSNVPLETARGNRTPKAFHSKAQGRGRRGDHPGYANRPKPNPNGVSQTPRLSTNNESCNAFGVTTMQPAGSPGCVLRKLRATPGFRVQPLRGSTPVEYDGFAAEREPISPLSDPHAAAKDATSTYAARSRPADPHMLVPALLP